MTWSESGLSRSAPAFGTPHIVCVAARSTGAVVSPAASWLSCQQLPTSCWPLRSARSPFVSLPKNSLPANELPTISLAKSSKKHFTPREPRRPVGFRSPPRQSAIGGGLASVSGKGTASIAHAPLCSKRLPTTVSCRPPAITIPVPTGPRSAEPAAGTFGLLLSWMKLPTKKVHDPMTGVPVTPAGHAPSCGEGASSLFWLFVEMPVLLWSNSEPAMTSRPPEFVPEYPSAEFTPCARERTARQSEHAPM